MKNLAPSFDHPFGTDWMGRDMLLRTLAGLSTSVLVGLLAAGVSSIIALVMGAVAALGGKKADAAVTWLIDLMLGIPHIVLLILISFALGKGFWGVTIGVAVTHSASRASCAPRSCSVSSRRSWLRRGGWGRLLCASRRSTWFLTCCPSSSWG